MAEVERSGYGLDVERMEGGMTPRLTWQTGCIVVPFIRPAFQFEVPLRDTKEELAKKATGYRSGAQKRGLSYKQK